MHRVAIFVHFSERSDRHGFATIFADEEEIAAAVRPLSFSSGQRPCRTCDGEAAKRSGKIELLNFNAWLRMKDTSDEIPNTNGN
jgi:hypothetical protein